MIEILKDTKFQKGFGAMGVTSEFGYQVKRVLAVDETSPEHDWLIAQWGTNHSFETEMTREEGVDNGNTYINFHNVAKEVVVYPGAGKLKLNAYASKEYVAPRKVDQPWVHLLLEQVFKGKQRVPFQDMVKLEMSLVFTVNRCDNMMREDEYNNSIHAGQISWYITVENSKSSEITPEGRPDYLWFGLPLYDNRFDCMGGSQQIDIGTRKLIYSVGLRETLGETVKVGNKYTIKYDILPEDKKAFKAAQKGGLLKGAQFGDMVIGSMNLGWELPGTFDAEFTIHDISIAYQKAK